MKRILALAITSVMATFLFVAGSAQVSAAFGSYRTYGMNTRGYYPSYHSNYYRNYYPNYAQHYNYNYRYPVRFYSNRDYFTRHNIFNRYPMFYRSFPSYFSPREFVIVDRDDFGRSFVVQNSLTGPFSVNRAVIRVNRDFYDRFYNNLDFNQDVRIDVDTGGNIVRFNTVTGNISTGDVDIEID
jgi:hypothetical protein